MVMGNTGLLENFSRRIGIAVFNNVVIEENNSFISVQEFKLCICLLKPHPFECCFGVKGQSISPLQ